MEEQQSTSGARTSGQKEERGSSRFRHQLETEAYAVQKQRWPKLGKFILAQYTRMPTLQTPQHPIFSIVAPCCGTATRASAADVTEHQPRPYWCIRRSSQR
jgi:hypothetical protein